MPTWEDVKNKTDIIQFIGQQIKLYPSGRSFKGLCPFHKEKTPSFFVSPEKQIWHCFGCNRGGDVFKFVMEMEKVEFGDALRLVAEKAGIVLKREDPQIATLKAKVYNALEEAAKFFETNLAKTKNALGYLSGRGILPNTIKVFRLGYAPWGWHGLYLHLRQLGFSDLELEQAGLVIKSSQPTSQGLSWYDRFRNRIIFPILDHTGKVIGFSGRILPREGQTQEDQGAKYINTPDTLAYAKGKVLFGFSLAKDAIKDSNMAFLVEGNMDMIMGWQSGIKNIAAVSGTALTEDQLIMLKRLCDTLVLNFDMDTAGELATDRSIALASAKGFAVKISELPEAKDLADFCLAKPGQAQSLLSSSTDIMQYYFSRAFQLELKTLEDKKQALAYLLPRIKVLPNVLERNVWLDKLSARLGIDSKMLFEEFKRVPSLLEQVLTQPAKQKVGESIFTRSRWEALAEMLLALAVRFPEHSQALKQSLDYFPARYRPVLTYLSGVDSPLEQLKQEDQEFLNYLMLLGEYELSLWGDDSEKMAGKEINAMLKALKKEKVRHDLRDISIAVQEAEQNKQSDRVKELMDLLQTKTNEFALLDSE